MGVSVAEKFIEFMLSSIAETTEITHILLNHEKLLEYDKVGMKAFNDDVCDGWEITWKYSDRKSVLGTSAEDAKKIFMRAANLNKTNNNEDEY